MEQQKNSNTSDNTTTQPSKFRTKNQFDLSGVVRGTYNAYSQINFKTVMLKSYLFDYNSAYILATGIIRSKSQCNSKTSRWQKQTNSI